MKRIFIIFAAALMFSLTAGAQPAKRRTTPAAATGAKGSATAKKTTGEKKVDRATLMFPTSAEMPFPSFPMTMIPWRTSSGAAISIVSST